MKRILATTLTTIVLMCSVSCGFGSSSKLSPEEIFKRQATKNAQAYISEKYGFEPKVTSCTPITDDTFSVPIDYKPGEDAKVTLKNGTESFIVIISGLNDSDDGKDDYQEKAISEAESEMIKKDFGPDHTMTTSTFSKIDDTVTNSGLRSKEQYYDGTNLKDMMYDSAHCCIEVYDQDLSDEAAFRDTIDTYSKTNKYFELCIVSYKDEQNYNSHIIFRAYLNKANTTSHEKLDEKIFKSNSDKISSYRRYFGDGTSEYVTFDQEPASENAESSNISENTQD